MTDPRDTAPTTPASTPETMDHHTGNDHSTHGANTNLDPSLQGGASTPEDQRAAQTIQDAHERDQAE
ncbi:hypothetical protein K7W42_08295 [Deinococcus sp. HMF7604]|uniref:hypothetical protein n=1 Tax=Deinococcus betulae TaxID=2873312 RepID=UPI001CC9435A|nr:hypothetical protein [Deinococcus betulae]MBZ9750860.1 hypothetical protein [Deinococcus betulae]